MNWSISKLELVLHQNEKKNSKLKFLKEPPFQSLFTFSLNYQYLSYSFVSESQKHFFFLYWLTLNDSATLLVELRDEFKKILFISSEFYN